MDWLNQLNVDKFILFTLVLTRVSGLTMTAPIYGTKDVPIRVRALYVTGLGSVDYAVAMARRAALSRHYAQLSGFYRR